MSLCSIVHCLQLPCLNRLLRVVVKSVIEDAGGEHGLLVKVVKMDVMHRDFLKNHGATMCIFCVFRLTHAQSAYLCPKRTDYQLQTKRGVIPKGPG